MFRYVEAPAFRETAVLVDLVDVDSQKWLDLASIAAPPFSWMHRLEGRRVRRLERRIGRRADALFVTTDSEADLHRNLVGGRGPLVANNGVDTEYYRPQVAPESPDSCCFVGVLNYQPNVDAVVWFVRNVWPLLRRKAPNAVFRIVGRSPVRSVKELDKNAGVELHADVPDVRPHLAASSTVVAPLRIARGVQNKVLEAMAMAKPVVASPAAVDGISAEHGREVIVATTADEWAIKLLTLQSDRSLAESLGGAARDFVERNHAWPACLAPVMETLEAIGEGKHSLRTAVA